MNRFPIQKKIVYPPENIKILCKAIKNHGDVSKCYEENFNNYSELHKALDPILKIRAKQMEIPEVENIEKFMELSSEQSMCLMKVELDASVESLIDLSIRKLSKLTDAMYIQKK